MKPVLIVVSPYYEDIADLMISGATAELREGGASSEIVSVFGAFEIPGAIACAAGTGRYSGYIALGCVIRGETTHYDTICAESAGGLQRLTIDEKLAIGYGILTCENKAQAIIRADPTQGNKGGDAAKACLRMIEVRKQYGRT